MHQRPPRQRRAAEPSSLEHEVTSTERLFETPYLIQLFPDEINALLTGYGANRFCHRYCTYTGQIMALPSFW